MGAQPARWIRHLREAGTANAYVVFDDGTTAGTTALVREPGAVKRPELMKVAKMAFPTANVRWGTMTNDQVIAAVTTGILPDEPQASQVVQVTAQEPVIDEPVNEPDTSTSTSYSQPEPQYVGTSTIDQVTRDDTSTDAASHLVEAIQAIAGQAVTIDQVRDQVSAMIEQALAGHEPDQGIDEEQIRKIVDDQVANLPIQRLEVVYRGQVNQVPDNHHEKLPRLITYLGAGRNVFLVGPAGTGKTTMAKQAAEALGLPFYSMSLEPTMNAVKFFGYQDANGNYVTTLLRQAYEFGGVMLLDEIDNGHPSVVAAINQATGGRDSTCAFGDGKMVPMHPDFLMVVTGNTWGHGGDQDYVGRNQLDKATLNRFVTLHVPTDERLERSIALALSTDESRAECIRWIDHVQSIRGKVQRAKVKHLVTPRQSIDGCALLTAGAPWEWVEEDALWSGLSEEQQAKVLAQ